MFHYGSYEHMYHRVVLPPRIHSAAYRRNHANMNFVHMGFSSRFRYLSLAMVHKRPNYGRQVPAAPKYLLDTCDYVFPIYVILEFRNHLLFIGVVPADILLWRFHRISACKIHVTTYSPSTLYYKFHNFLRIIMIILLCLNC